MSKLQWIQPYSDTYITWKCVIFILLLNLFFGVRTIKYGSAVSSQLWTTRVDSYVHYSYLWPLCPRGGDRGDKSNAIQSKWPQIILVLGPHSVYLGSLYYLHLDRFDANGWYCLWFLQWLMFMAMSPHKVRAQNHVWLPWLHFVQ